MRCEEFLGYPTRIFECHKNQDILESGIEEYDAADGLRVLLDENIYHWEYLVTSLGRKASLSEIHSNFPTPQTK